MCLFQLRKRVVVVSFKKHQHQRESVLYLQLIDITSIRLNFKLPML